MRQTTAPSVLDTLATDTLAALRCPHWCVAPADHGLTDTEVAVSGGIWREHQSAETVVGKVRVRTVAVVDYSLDEGLQVSPPSVQVWGDGELSGRDALRLAAVIADHAAALRRWQ